MELRHLKVDVSKENKIILAKGRIYGWMKQNF